MSTIEWKDSFSVNNELMDDQHKQWIEIHNKAHNAMMDRSADKTNIGKNALKKIKDFSTYHFACEEEHMQNIGYSDIETHKKIHNNFTRKVENYINEMEQGKLVLNSEVIKMLERWLLDHVLTEDKNYGQ